MRKCIFGYMRPNEDSDQPGHSYSRTKISQGTLWKVKIPRFFRQSSKTDECVNAQAILSVHSVYIN